MLFPCSNLLICLVRRSCYLNLNSRRNLLSFEIHYFVLCISLRNKPSYFCLEFGQLRDCYFLPPCIWKSLLEIQFGNFQLKCKFWSKVKVWRKKEKMPLIQAGKDYVRSSNRQFFSFTPYLQWSSLWLRGVTPQKYVRYLSNLKNV